MTIYRATVLALLITLVIGTVELTARTAVLADQRRDSPIGAKNAPEMKIVDIRRGDFQELLARDGSDLRATLGLEPGDTIVSVNNRSVGTPELGHRLAGAAWNRPTNSFIDIGVDRRGRLIRVIVLLHDA